MRSVKYIAEIMRRRSFPEFFNALDNHVDLKEWSEVGAMFEVARKVLSVSDYDVILDVGCGKRPTLGILMALNYGNEKRTVVSIDPQLATTYASNIKYLSKFKGKLSELPKISSGIKVLVLANHAHVSKNEMKKFLSTLSSWTYVTCPCCIDNKLDDGKYIKDIHSWSPKNEIYIFNK